VVEIVGAAVGVIGPLVYTVKKPSSWQVLKMFMNYMYIIRLKLRFDYFLNSKSYS